MTPAAPPAGTATAGYRLPPEPIPQILATPPTPAISISPDRTRFALFGRDNLPPVAELALPELRLAGIRINPRTNGPSRETFYNAIAICAIGAVGIRSVPLPEGSRISFPRWSPDGSRIAFANTTDAGIELWVADIATAEARRLLGPDLNAAMPGAPFEWMPDSQSLLAKVILHDRGDLPDASLASTGPVVQENLGTTAPARTYQDLLNNEHDAALFDFFFTARVARVPVDGGSPTNIGPAGILTDLAPSPNGEYLFVEWVTRPYSYRVPWYRFPTEAEILDVHGKRVRLIAELPLAEDVPIAFDAVPTGPRSIAWRADAGATLAWVEALDGGDPRRSAAVRDRVFVLDAPFADQPRILIDLEHRYAGTLWGRDDVALVFSRWWNIRNERRHVVAPGHPGSEPRLLVERSYEDRYKDPGMPLTHPNRAGRSVLHFTPDGQGIWLAGAGASPRGDYPFLARMELATGESTRTWRAEDPHYESVVTLLDSAGTRMLTRREGLTEPPNYFVRDLGDGSTVALTDFPDPAPQLAGIGREIISYARADGVRLSATLFTPPGYDPEHDGPLPLLVWAYPREFRDADVAGQINDSRNRFSRPGGPSHLFLLTQGYAVLDGPAMPIIGEGEAEPNDSYVEQLVSNARAAVQRVVNMGVADPDRVAIGGHSYGAFMAANLLAHSDLFRAGIARSGAYNRTLTPFGFQAEQRSYWEAPETYHRMSPFSYADRIRDPILLIHGEADNNSGTFPLQSERFYAALKGHGATVRYVVLPYESHGYQARESVLHTLAEMVEWMDRYVKNAPPRPDAKRTVQTSSSRADLSAEV